MLTLTTTTRVIRVWPEGSSEQLQDCFSDTDWAIFEEDNIDTYTSSVLSYIKFYRDNITTTKKIHVIPNSKPWMTRNCQFLLQKRNTAFQSGDLQRYKAARANLKRGIKDAKAAYEQKIKHLFSCSDPRQAWQGICQITRQNNTSSTSSGSVLEAEQLNRFFARFDTEGMTTTIIQTPTVRPLSFSLQTSSAHSAGSTHGRQPAQMASQDKCSETALQS